MKISFVVLTYNRTDALLAVLRSLSRQCGADHEVLIADDGSTAAHVAELYKGCPTFKCPVRHIWHSDLGFTASAARNLGAFVARGDYLVFIDGDCVPGKSFVEAHTKLAEVGFFVNGSRVLLSEGLSNQVLIQNIELSRKPFSFWLKARIRGESNKLLHMLFWPWSLFRVQAGFRWHGIRSCNFGVWRHDFVAVNGFDETFEGWGHEDADLVLRLCHFGLKRKNGFWATEVFHLWHLENKRDHEAINKQKVLDRAQTSVVVAVKGLAQIDPEGAFNVKTLH